MEKTKLKSHSGMSLIEVMIVMTIMSMIGLGTATLMKNMFSIQRRNNLKVIATEIKLNLENVLKNDTAWGYTVNAPANSSVLGCLDDDPGTTCANGIYGPYNVKDTEDAMYFRGRLATAGFDEEGLACNSYVQKPGAGDDDCPFHYILTWEAICPPGIGSPCPRPQVRIIGNFEYNPSDPSDPRNRLNEADYDIDFRRGERVRYEPLQITYREANSSGGGACASNVWRTRSLNGPPDYDAGGNATVAGNRFTLVAGTYSCKVSAQAYEALQGFSLRLRNITAGTDINAGGGYSSYNTTVYSSANVTIEITTDSTFELQHMCVGTSARSNFDMGLPVRNASGTYTGAGTLFTSISCIRTS